MDSDGNLVCSDVRWFRLKHSGFDRFKDWQNKSWLTPNISAKVSASCIVRYAMRNTEFHALSRRITRYI